MDDVSEVGGMTLGSVHGFRRERRMDVLAWASASGRAPAEAGKCSAVRCWE